MMTYHPIKLMILSGLPCSGKSRWTDAFIKDNPDKKVHVFSTDAIIEEEAQKLDTTYNEVFSKVIRDAERIAVRRLHSALISDHIDVVIFDQTNLSLNKRNKIITTFIPQQINNYSLEYHCFLPPETEREEEIWKAMQKHRADNEGKYINEDVLDSMARSYQIPCPMRTEEKPVFYHRLSML